MQAQPLVWRIPNTAEQLGMCPQAREATAVKSPCTRTKEQPPLIAARESQAQQQRPSAA